MSHQSKQIQKSLRELDVRLAMLEKQNKFMQQALRDIRDHDEDESWTYEILQFVASEALKFNRQVAEMSEYELLVEEFGPAAVPKSPMIQKLIDSQRF